MKQKTVDNIYMGELDMPDEVSTRPMPAKELEPVQLDNQPEHLVYIGSKLARDVRSLLINFLKQNMEVFAWNQEDIGGIDPQVERQSVLQDDQAKKEFYPRKAEGY